MLNTFFVVFTLFIIGTLFMVAMLKFSRWREREVGCCYDVLKDVDDGGDSCDTCPLREGEA